MKIYDCVRWCSSVDPSRPTFWNDMPKKSGNGLTFIAIPADVKNFRFFVVDGCDSNKIKIMPTAVGKCFRISKPDIFSRLRDGYRFHGSLFVSHIVEVYTLFLFVVGCILCFFKHSARIHKTNNGQTVDASFGVYLLECIE